MEKSVAQTKLLGLAEFSPKHRLALKFKPEVIAKHRLARDKLAVLSVAYHWKINKLPEQEHTLALKLGGTSSSKCPLLLNEIFGTLSRARTHSGPASFKISHRIIGNTRPKKQYCLFANVKNKLTFGRIKK